ncbi:amino acid ABC transporter permease [Phaeacidiphilus oryzae]|uniref:amino acid ABC transporter permease n=1 Tax=Phaeacidiphilus oryzae TaxID=348818 RepID=UPI000689D834|nr:amino acid ABC transporter permease [Phaeacidiphilus oryzae]
MAPDDTPATTQQQPPEEIRAVPVRHPGRWVAVAVLAVLAAMFGHLVATNKALQLSVVRQYVFNPAITHGVVVTLELTILSMLIGVAGGILLAVMRLSPNPVLSGVSWLYLWVFRGTPVLVQLLVWNFLGALVPVVSIGVPFGPGFASTSYNTLVPTFTAALLGLGLNEAAYMAEIVRAGILSVDEGQNEAASSLGMTRGQTLRRIVLPQAMRMIIPPTGNEIISMLKTTSLVSVIALEELTRATEDIYARTFQNIPMLMVACCWYLFLTSLLTIAQYYVERHYARGANRELPPTPWQRVRRTLFSLRRQPVPTAAAAQAAPPGAAR